MLHKKKDRTDSGKYRGISHVAHAGSLLIKIPTSLTTLSPKGSCQKSNAASSRLSTIDKTMLVVHRLQEMG